MRLSSGKQRVIKIRKNKAKIFSTLVIGDIIEISTLLNIGSYHRDGYATLTTVFNHNTGESTNKTVNEIEVILKGFEFETVTENDR